MQERPLAETLWSIRQSDGQVISCQLRADDNGHCDVLLQVNGERMSERRFLSHASAELQADAMKDRMIAAVRGVLVTARRMRRSGDRQQL
jgi:hypothetical protein